MSESCLRDEASIDRPLRRTVVEMAVLAVLAGSGWLSCPFRISCNELPMGGEGSPYITQTTPEDYHIPIISLVHSSPGLFVIVRHRKYEPRPFNC